VLTASNVCATSQQEYQRLGLCAESVQGRHPNHRRLLMRNALAEVFRIGFVEKAEWSKCEIRQDFGAFCQAAVKTLTQK
jgi:hypothetical protein